MSGEQDRGVGARGTRGFTAPVVIPAALVPGCALPVPYWTTGVETSVKTLRLRLAQGGLYFFTGMF